VVEVVQDHLIDVVEQVAEEVEPLTVQDKQEIQAQQILVVEVVEDIMQMLDLVDQE
jgi:hypothetical protein